MEMGRLYVMPYELLLAWEHAHRQLTPAERQAFVQRSICVDIGSHPDRFVFSAVKMRTRLTDILETVVELEEAAKLAAIEKSRTRERTPRTPREQALPEGPVVTHLPDGAAERPSRLSKAQKRAAAAHRLENPTDAEAALWQRLKNRRLDGFSFQREYLIQGWWADFYCASARLVVEVDGVHHKERRAEDNRRDEVMTANHYRVIRVPAQQVFNNIEAVLDEIGSALRASGARPSGHWSATTSPAKSPVAAAAKTGRGAPRSGEWSLATVKKERLQLFYCSPCDMRFPHPVDEPAHCPKCRKLTLEKLATPPAKEA
jgi:very-short-patch-repair endonuclease